MKKIILILISISSFFYSCTEEPQEYMLTEYTYSKAVFDYFKSLTSLSYYSYNQKDIKNFGFKGIDSSFTDSVDAVFFISLVPNSSEIMRYSVNTKKPIIYVDAFFKTGDNQLTTENYVGLDYKELKKIGEVDSYIIPYFSYKPENVDSSYYYNEEIQLIVKEKNGSISEMIRLPNNLFPIILTNNGEGLDTLSITKGINVSYGNSDSSWYNTFNLYSVNHYLYYRTNIIVNDVENNYDFKKELFNEFQFINGSAVVYEIIKYKIYTKYYQEINKKYAFIIYTTAANGAYIKI